MPQTEQSHYTPSTNTPAKQYEFQTRLTWAAGFPLKPGRDVMSRRGLLVLIAECSISGSFYESQQKLAERAGMSVRGIQKALAKLCDEGALWARPRGFKRTTRYTLMRLAEVAEHGDFLPPGAASDSPLETNPSSPQTTKSPPFETNSSSPQIAFETNPSSYKEDITTRRRTPPYPPFTSTGTETGNNHPHGSPSRSIPQSKNRATATSIMGSATGIFKSG